MATVTVLECSNCARPVPDGAAICSRCAQALATALRGVPALLDDLLVTLSKQDRLADTAGKRGKGAEQPLPVRFDISAQLAAFTGELTTWARDLVETHGLDVPDPPRRSSYPGLDIAAYAAVWLAEHVHLLRRHPAADEAHRKLTDAIAAAEAACSAPPARLFSGRCDQCGADLYGWPDHRAVRCERCGAEYTATAMRERWDGALLRLRGCPATAATIASGIGELFGVTVNRLTISKWHSRGKITPVDWVPLGERGDREAPRFRIGAVLDYARGGPEKAG